jgi:hypothetical protein
MLKHEVMDKQMIATDWRWQLQNLALGASAFSDAGEHMECRYQVAERVSNDILG